MTVHPNVCGCGRTFRTALGLERHQRYQRHEPPAANMPEAMAQAIEKVEAGLAALDRAVVPAVADWLNTLDHQAVVETVDWVQRTRDTLAKVEAYVVRELGRDDTRPVDFTLADGRTAELLKGKDRKEWRHADWQRDVRHAVVADANLEGHVLVSQATGDSVDPNPLLLAMLAAVQGVHGAGAPKVTALKALDLAADDYCTSYPGPWALRITKPEPASPTTTERTA